MGFPVWRAFVMRSEFTAILAATLVVSAGFLGCAQAAGSAEASNRKTAVVHALAETDPVPGKKDAADDPAIWVHPRHPDSSLVIGTDKSKKKGGLHVYDLTGREVGSVSDPALNNVDLRQAIVLGKDTIDLVVATRRRDSSIALYSFDPQKRVFHDLAVGHRNAGEVYGLCLYRSPASGRVFAFLPRKSGHVSQIEILGGPDGRLDWATVRELQVPSQSEGCAADDAAMRVYVAEEDRGLWSFAAEPDSSASGFLVDSVGGGRLVADVEGIAVVSFPDGAGWILVSSQGDDSYAIYDRKAPHSWIGSFRIADGSMTDGTSGTDGIEASSAVVTARYPGGLMVVQDDINPGSTQNFKYIPLDSIRAVFGR